MDHSGQFRRKFWRQIGDIAAWACRVVAGTLHLSVNFVRDAINACKTYHLVDQQADQARLIVGELRQIVLRTQHVRQIRPAPEIAMHHVRLDERVRVQLALFRLWLMRTARVRDLRRRNEEVGLFHERRDQDIRLDYLNCGVVVLIPHPQFVHFDQWHVHTRPDHALIRGVAELHDAAWDRPAGRLHAAGVDLV